MVTYPAGASINCGIRFTMVAHVISTVAGRLQETVVSGSPMNVQSLQSKSSGGRSLIFEISSAKRSFVNPALKFLISLQPFHLIFSSVIRKDTITAHFFVIHLPHYFL